MHKRNTRAEDLNKPKMPTFTDSSSGSSLPDNYLENNESNHQMDFSVKKEKHNNYNIPPLSFDGEHSESIKNNFSLANSLDREPNEAIEYPETNHISLTDRKMEKPYNRPSVFPEEA